MNVLYFAFLGLLSGALSAGALDPALDLVVKVFGIRFPGSFFSILPGFVFGIVVGSALMAIRSVKTAHGIAILVASIAGSAVAFWLAVFLVLMAKPQDDQALPVFIAAGALAGAVGGGILGVVISVLLKVKAWRWLVLSGGLAGAFLPLINYEHVGYFSSLGIFAFYMIWQASYAAVLEAALSASKLSYGSPRGIVS